jgi:uncharacterized repeat protein (TIGR01451 family)
MRRFLTGLTPATRRAKTTTSTASTTGSATGRPFSLRTIWPLLALAATLAAVFLVAGATGAPGPGNPSADIDQCANGGVGDPPESCNDSFPSNWINGDLVASKAHYFEGDSVAYRMKFDNLNTADTHAVIIEYDTLKGGKHALDYLTSFDRTVTDANPCTSVPGCSGPPDTEPIPVDGTLPFAQIPGDFALFGGTITSVSGPSFPGGADNPAQYTINFMATVANPVLAWGGHIATRQDWGNGNAAINISGSPYHMRLKDLDGGGGNQDRALSAAAVIFRSTITIVKHANGPTSTAFNFTSSPGLPDTSPVTSFSLTDNSSSTDASRTFTADAPSEFTTYSVTEADPSPAYALTGLVCTEDQGQNTTTNLGTRTAAINVDEGEIITCTFTNTAQTAALTIDKTSTTASITAAGQVVPYSYLVTNTGNVTLTGITVTDPNIDTPPGMSCPSTTLAVGAHMTCTAQHTVTQTEFNAGGNLTNTGIADSTQTEPQQDTLSIPIVSPQKGQILPTATTCQNYKSGASSLTDLAYNVSTKGGVSKIGSVAPGVLFYYNTITLAAAQSVTITETNNSTTFGSNNWPAIPIQDLGQVILFNFSTCLKSSAQGTTTFNATTGSVTISVTAPGTYIIGIKYNPGALVGTQVFKSAGKFPAVTYTWATTGFAGSTASVLVSPKK